MDAGGYDRRAEFLVTVSFHGNEAFCTRHFVSAMQRRWKNKRYDVLLPDGGTRHWIMKFKRGKIVVNDMSRATDLMVIAEFNNLTEPQVPTLADIYNGHRGKFGCFSSELS